MTNLNVAGFQPAAVTVHDSTKFELEVISLEALNNRGTPGLNTVNANFDAASGFLQRLAQKIEWRQKDNARGKAYIHSLIKGSYNLDAFVIVPADLIKLSAEQNLDEAILEAKAAWSVVLKYVKDAISDGTEFFIIDGQNRLNESLIPFFNNKIPFNMDPLQFDVDGKAFHCAGKYFKDLPEEIQSYIKNIEVPLVRATSGDIESFSNAIIWKNEGIAWNDWQKMIMRMWYTKFRRQTSSITSVDEGDAPSRKALNLVKSDKYSYDKNGHDRLVAEFLAWMHKQDVPFSSVKSFSPYFEGTESVSETEVKSLKRYLKDFGLTYKNTKVSNTEMRNYVMLRHVIDNPKKYKKLTTPSWKIKKAIDFTKKYQILTKTLMSNSQDYGELPPTTTGFNQGGDKFTSKTPGSYNAFNSQNDKEMLTGRLEILLRVITGETDNKKSNQFYNSLIEEGIVIEVDSNKMPTVFDVYQQNPNDADGNHIPLSKLNNTDYHVGHKTAYSKGGSNTNVVLQKGRDNIQWQADYEHGDELHAKLSNKLNNLLKEPSLNDK